jgi:hypothetical protein
VNVTHVYHERYIGLNAAHVYHGHYIDVNASPC